MLITGILSQTSGADPSSLFTQLGAFAAACVALVLWQRDTARQRDRLLDLEEKRGPLLVEVRDVMRQVLEVLRATSDATKSMAEALERVPSEAEITRLRDALAASEGRRRGTSGGS